MIRLIRSEKLPHDRPAEYAHTYEVAQQTDRQSTIEAVFEVQESIGKTGDMFSMQLNSKSLQARGTSVDECFEKMADWFEYVAKGLRDRPSKRNIPVE